jgi:hypothetical protein
VTASKMFKNPEVNFIMLSNLPNIYYRVGQTRMELELE